MVGAHRRRVLVAAAAAIVLSSTCTSMPRATAFLLASGRRAGVVSAAWALRGGRHHRSTSARMGLDQGSRPTPRGPGFRFLRAGRRTALGSSSSDEFAAINAQTLNWEKVGPEEDVFISALSQNGQVRCGAVGIVAGLAYVCVID